MGPPLHGGCGEQLGNTCVLEPSVSPGNWWKLTGHQTLEPQGQHTAASVNNNVYILHFNTKYLSNNNLNIYIIIICIIIIIIFIIIKWFRIHSSITTLVLSILEQDYFISRSLMTSQVTSD